VGGTLARVYEAWCGVNLGLMYGLNLGLKQIRWLIMENFVAIMSGADKQLN
jgi:hypothetical protein